MFLRAIVLGLGAGFSAASAPAFAACNLTKIVELPITMVGRKPMAPVKINGAEVSLVISSGSAIGALSPATAAALKLPQLQNRRVIGLGGVAYTSVLTTVNTLTLSNQVLHDVPFIITPGAGRGTVGENLLGRGDIEYDFADKAVRLFKAQDCVGSNMAYWVKGEDYSVLGIDWQNDRNPHTKANAQVNGVPVTVTFSTGSAASALSLTAAERLGLKVDGTGTRYLGLARGVGPQAVKSWIVPVASIKIGHEEIRNTQLRVIDEAAPGLDSDMMIGADFFLSHRVFVANSQHQLYFTYIGGPVFRLDEPPAPEAAGQD
jgi:predicted aspartyl protease